jgi:hypothetical protein
MLLLEKESLTMPLLAEIVFETLPGGGVFSVVRDGVGLGSVIAVVCSWQRNRSIFWAIVAGLLSWLYVAYFALTRRPDETRGGS